jgi:hypothetical protein
MEIYSPAPLPRFIYVAGSYYPTFGGSGTATIIAAADTIYLQPFMVLNSITADRLAVRVTTGQATSAVKGAIYGTRTSGAGVGRPFGAPIGADNTGVATTTSNANADLTLSAALVPGLLYWSAVKFTTAGTLPTCTSSLTTSRNNEVYIGRDMPSNAAGSGAATGLSFAQAYATAFPTFDGTEVWTTVTAAALPVTWLRAA